MTEIEFPERAINGNAVRCEYWWSTSTALEPMREAILDDPAAGDLMCVREAGHPGPHLLATGEALQANYPTPLEGAIPDDEDYTDD